MTICGTKNAPVITGGQYNVVNGVAYCTGTVDITGAADPRVFKYDPAKQYFLLMAYGPTSADGLSHHEHDTGSNHPVILTDVQNVITTFDPSECGVSKGCYAPTEQECYGKPSGLMFAYQKMNDSYFHFQLMGTVKKGDDAYVAVGFSGDNMMGNESVLECSSLGKGAPISFKFSYNNAKPANVRIDGEQDIRANYIENESQYNNEQFYCDGLVKVSGDPTKPEIFKYDPTNRYHILLAIGVASKNGLGRHSTSCVSPMPIDLSSVQNNFDSSTCGVDKACFMPTEVNGMAFSYKLLSDTKMQVEFTSLMSGPNQYVAVGFSQDNMMGNDYVIECSSIPGTDDAGPFSIKYSYNVQQSNATGQPTNVRVNTGNPLTTLVTNFTSITQDGELYCSGIIDISQTSNPQMLHFDNSTNYYLLMACGNTTAGGLTAHHQLNKVSAVLYNMASPQTIPVPTPTPPVNTGFDCADCGQTKGCLFPDGSVACTGSGAAWTMIDQTTMSLELMNTGSEKYIAVGFKIGDNRMASSSVIECSQIGNAAYSMKFSYNDQQPKNVRIPGEQAIEGTYFTDETAKLEDGRLYCKAKVNVGGWAGSTQVFKMQSNQSYYMLMAKGDTTATGLVRHTWTRTSAAPIDLFSTSLATQPTAPPSTTPPPNAGFDCLDCGKTKGCLFPDGSAACTGSGAAWTMIDQTTMSLELMNTGAEKYIAVGFKIADNMMASSYVIECSQIGQAAYSMKFSYNDQQPKNVRIAGEQAIEKTYFMDETAKLEDGRLYCKAKVNVGGWLNSDQVFKIQSNQSYYMLMAKGETNATGLLQHKWARHTSAPVDLFSATLATEPTAAPTTPPPANSGFDCSACAVTKSCYFLGGGCDGAGAAWTMIDNTTMSLELLNPGSDQYVAIGFKAGDNKMAGSSVIECSKIGNAAYSMKFSYNDQQPKNVRIAGEQAIEGTYFTDETAKFEDGRLYCKAKVNVGGWAGSTQVFKVDLSQSYYIFLAKGPTDGNGLLKHNSAKASTSSLKLNAVGTLKTSTKRDHLIRAHAILMILAWICFIPTALLFARFLRNSWPLVKPGGLLIWFHVHRTANMLGICLMIASFVCIMTANKWNWTGPGSKGTPYYSKVHTMVGLLALCLAWLQPFISTIRCSPNNPKRPVFNWIHRGIGVVAFSLAITAIAIASATDDFNAVWTNPGVQLGLTLAALGVIIGMCIIFPILDYLQSKETTDHKNWERIRQVLVLLALLFLFGDGIALSVMVGVGAA